MSEQPKQIRIGPGDPVSQLVQVIAGEAGIRRIYVGKGREDLRSVLIDLHNATVKAEEAWKAIKELFDMPELAQLPEAIQAKLMAGILQARANCDLRAKV